MLANSYTGIVEPHIERLILSRARRLRISGSEIDDLQQQIVPKLVEFRFDESRSNGASRETVMTCVIDRQMKAHLRAKHRYQKRLERLQLMFATRSRPVWPHHVSQPEPTDLRLDLRDAIRGLSPRDRAVCEGLSQGLAIKAIATKLACGRDTVSRAIVRIRRAFTAAGLAAWVDPDHVTTPRA